MNEHDDSTGRGEWRGTIDNVSLYEVLPDGTRIKYEPSKSAIESWEYKFRDGEYICERCGGVVRDDNKCLHMRCKRT